jgi:hypothetical protein
MKQLKIAVSGTYSTGKTTTTEAISLLTGITRTHARTMREILPDAIPGKTLEQCNPAELLQLGIRRYTERAIREKEIEGGFFSDGSSLHEWIYGVSRMSVGISPNDGALKQTIMRIARYPFKKVFEEIIENFGSIVKSHAKDSYDEFIHLPIEFPLVEDGHRPVSEKFRALSDELLIATLNELNIKYHIVSGSIEERLEKITDIYGFKKVMPIEDAIEQAKSRAELLMKTRE